MQSLFWALVICGLSVTNSVSAQQSGTAAPTPINPEPVATSVTPEVVSAVPPTPTPTPNPYAGDLLARKYMTGDWNGWRSRLAERGVTMDLFVTQFYQGVTSGGLSREFEYGGKLDYQLNVDGGKLGLWQGLSMNMHVENKFGTSTNPIDGTLIPTNASMAFPLGDQTGTWITALKLNQVLSEHFVVFAGKLNGLDGYALKYTPSVDTNLPGLGGFQNTALVFNPIAARGVPYSAAAAGAAYLFGQGSTLGFSVLDPDERADRGLDNLFRVG